MEIADLVRVDQSKSRIENFKRENENALLVTDERKVAQMFIDVVLDVHIFTYVAALIGADSYEDLSNSLSLEDLANKISQCGIFQLEIGEEYKGLHTIIKAWHNNMSSTNFLDINCFLQECIIELSQGIPLTSKTNEVVVDIKK